LRYGFEEVFRMNGSPFPQQAAYKAKHLTLPDTIWNRPKVQGFTGSGIATKKQNAKNRAAKPILEQLQRKAG
jgi:hypothetical protein